MDTRGEMTAMVNLMAHPMAGVASASAIGMGLASQMMGIWLGTVMGSAAVARRLMDAAPMPAASPEAGRADVARKARAATDAVIADARAKVIQLSTAAERRNARKARPVASRAEAAAPAKAARAAPKAESRRKAEAPVALSSGADDLKRISGIGPKLEQALNRLGISSFATLAALSDADVARIDEQLGLNGRIARDAWIVQARLNLETDRAAPAAGGE